MWTDLTWDVGLVPETLKSYSWALHDSLQELGAEDMHFALPDPHIQIIHVFSTPLMPSINVQEVFKLGVVKL